MAKRTSEMAWWLAAVASGVLLALALLLIAWSVHKPWLPSGLDVHLREVWFEDAFMSAPAFLLLTLNLWAVKRRWCVAEVTGANQTGANFTGAELTHASLSWYTNTNATRANLTRADLRGADLSHALLKGASLHDADLRNAQLHDPNYLSWPGKGADLRDADLTGADLRVASLYAVILTSARYDARTRWPRWFDPKRRGAKLIKPPAAHHDGLPV